MCGIYGVSVLQGKVALEKAIIQRDKLQHRGPDSFGEWISDDHQLALFHRRLSIQDLSSAGHQPMTSRSGRFTLVFNGEIYNFLEIKKELSSFGYIFHSTSDTEIILAAWEQWGEEALHKFNGMFAFALYDKGNISNAPNLYLVRDRLGKKPLYYSCINGLFEFASELKAMSIAGKISLSALNHYLALGYIPHNQCIVEGIYKLPPAYIAKINLKTFNIQLRKYWYLPENHPDPFADSESLADEAGLLIESATALRLIADVPVGVLLSGGLDSSIVTAAAARVSSHPLQTFTIVLPGSKLNEADFARKIAGYFGTEHHELPLLNNSFDSFDAFKPFIDEPLADSSILPSYLLSQLTRNKVKVALGGDGGDELFGGYDDYPRTLADSRRLKYCPTLFLKYMALCALQLPAGIRGRNRLGSLSHGVFEQMIWGRPYFDTILRKRVLSEDAFQNLLPDIDAPERFLQGFFSQGIDTVDSMTRTHVQSILPDDFLVKVDRASMAASLEMRTPLLDYRLVEFAFGKIPSSWKVNLSETRRIQRILAKRWLPKEIDFSRKQGFSIPLDLWLRQLNNSWHDQWIESLPAMINRDESRRLVQGLHKGRANGARIFALAMLSISCHNLGLSA